MDGYDERDAKPDTTKQLPPKPDDPQKDPEQYYKIRHGHGDFIILGDKCKNENDRQTQDITKLKKLSDFLRADLEDWTGKNNEEILEAFKQFSTDQKRKRKDFIIVFILSEAKHLNHIRGAAREDYEDDHYKLDDVLTGMAYVKDTKVLDIPKLFFVQNIPPKVTDKGTGSDGDDSKSTSCHRMADFFVSFNKEYDIYDMGDSRFCSTYIHLLDSEIRNAVKQGWGFFTTMAIVHDKLAKEYEKNQKHAMTQAPRFHSMLRHDVKFNALNEN